MHSAIQYSITYYMNSLTKGKNKKSNEKIKNIKSSSLHSTVQYRPLEMKIVFGLKVPSIDGLGLILG